MKARPLFLCIKQHTIQLADPFSESMHQIDDVGFVFC
jgi:hypothetical protein